MKLQTLGPDYTFPKIFGALNPNPTSELLHHVRFPRNPNLKVQKTLFFAIFGVKLHRKLIFFLKNRYGIWKYQLYPLKPFLNFSDIFFFEISFIEVEYFDVFVNTPFFAILGDILYTVRKF